MGYGIFFSLIAVIILLRRDVMASPITQFGKKKKRSHDLAYLLVLLTILFGTFLFVTVYVNALLRGIPIPH